MTPDFMARARHAVEQTRRGGGHPAFIEGRICGDRHSRRLAGSICEIRRRLELLERWRHYHVTERSA